MHGHKLCASAADKLLVEGNWILGWQLFFEFWKVKKAVDFLVPISLKTQHTKFRWPTITQTRASLHLKISTYLHTLFMVFLESAALPPITQDLLDGSRWPMHHSIQRMRFHQPFWRWRPWVTSVTFIGQGVTCIYFSDKKINPLTFEGQ